MIAKLFSRRRTGVAPATKAPEGRRIYAIGDIHGRLDLLERLLKRICRDEEARGGPRGDLIFLGDLIDRGPQSAGVVDRLMALREERPGTRFLMGNHEEVFLAALEGDLKRLRLFHRIGGRETILSYGITQDAYANADFESLAEMVQAAVPAAHRAFFESFENMIVEGDYVFVHAGIRPGVALEDQRTSDLRWIREEFLSGQGPHGKAVVHGHTVFDEVVDLQYRIGIDTGAFRPGGALTAMGFEDANRWILQERCPQSAEVA